MSNLISINITPTDPTTDVIPLETAKKYVVADFDERDEFIDTMIASARQRLERYACLVFLPSKVECIYKQYGCGDQIDLGYCNGIDLKSVEGLPDGLVIEGFGSQRYIETKERKLTLSYNAGYSTPPDFVIQAVEKQVAWDFIHLGDEGLSMSPEALAILQPHRAFIPL